jgi:DNA-binding NtrC family response regulator
LTLRKEIWLLDSNLATGASLALIMEDWGFRARHVADAAQAEALDFSVPPALLVLDDEYLVDETLWLTFERRMALAWTTMPPIILMSRRPNQRLQRRASTVLEKPVDLDGLRALVQRLAAQAA